MHRRLIRFIYIHLSLTRSSIMFIREKTKSSSSMKDIFKRASSTCIYVYNNILQKNVGIQQEMRRQQFKKHFLYRYTNLNKWFVLSYLCHDLRTNRSQTGFSDATMGGWRMQMVVKTRHLTRPYKETEEQITFSILLQLISKVWM